MILLYFLLRLFYNLPPKLKPNIDNYTKNPPLYFTDKEASVLRDTLMQINIFDGLCITKYLDTRDKAILQYCKENDLGRNVGGGCYHLLGSYSTYDTFYALKYCNIKTTVTLPEKYNQ